MPTFDPWNDARSLARHLAQPEAELLVVLGAEAWCQKCLRLRPLFDALCSNSMPAHVAWMWLDLEDHAEFLDGFIPPDLPLLLRWRQGHCVQAAIVEDVVPGASPADRVRLRPLALDESGMVDPHQGRIVALPPLWRELSATAWAEGR
ncbi:MAG: thioredoxin [Mitsuaria chitosanitabida]|uniref:thioredoxin n=1 Tax=Roseateles chitosanitabidus TaxID=65048 RepID=UPI001B07477E|nr:thioredoxin [Roseateles chitosanitabidus]MBO9688285.1 thioredoxin [Roseateles chitosanitabidus]